MGWRKPRDLDNFFVLTALGIVRESARIVLQHLPFFASIAALLISPVSAAIILSHVVLDRLLVAKIAIQVQALGYASGLSDAHFTKIICHKLSESIASYIVCFPFVITFSLFAKAAVVHTVAYIYAGNKPSVHRLIEALPKVWKRLLVTYLWVCLIVLGSNALVFLLMSAFTNLLSILGCSSNWAIWAALGGGIVYSIVFAHAMIVCNLANIVSVMEDCFGIDAVLRAKFLIRGRTQIALLMALITNLSMAFVESLFQYRVMGRRRNPSVHHISSSSSSVVWEAPLLIFMYALVGLMDAVMSSVFYYTCKSSRLEGFCLNSSSLLNSLENEISSNPSDLKAKLLSMEWTVANQA
eukprot:Gb_15635 [translate_table: standard]